MWCFTNLDEEKKILFPQTMLYKNIIMLDMDCQLALLILVKMFLLAGTYT